MRRVILLGVLAVGGMFAATLPASAATSASQCKQAVSQLKDDIAALVPATGVPKTGSAAATALKQKAGAKYAKASAAHPDCRAQFAEFGSQLAGTTGKETPQGTPFLGPIGWLWNEIYYAIFQGSTVLMVMFGWELFLSPFIFVFCLVAVFRGTAGLLKKPYVPPELRTNES